jgi:hypothetical protein
MYNITPLFYSTLKTSIIKTLKVKITLPVFLIKYHVIRAYGRVVIHKHIFITLAPDGGEWSASCPSWSRFFEEEM